MGFSSLTSRFLRRLAVEPDLDLRPYFGVASFETPMEQKNGDFIKSLTGRGPTESRVVPSMTLDSYTGSGFTMFFASPVQFGEVTFLDIESNFEGGWDGVHSDWGQTLGPIIVPVNLNGTVVDFYLYQTDFEEIGLVEWKVS